MRLIYLTSLALLIISCSSSKSVNDIYVKDNLDQSLYDLYESYKNGRIDKDFYCGMTDWGLFLQLQEKGTWNFSAKKIMDNICD